MPEDEPSQTTRDVLAGFEDWLTDLYACPMRLSTLLAKAGLADEELFRLKEPQKLDALVMRLCPKLREWLIAAIGMKAACAVIGRYGLYGERHCVSDIANELGLTERHVQALRRWALKRLQQEDNKTMLQEMSLAAAGRVLHSVA